MSETESQNQNFVHLHVHTQYSLLESVIRVKPLIQKVKDLGMPAVALTDSNNLFGAIDFYTAAQSADIQPIIGCAVLFTPVKGGTTAGAMIGSAADARSRFKPQNFQLILLCKNLEGYKNLCQLISRAYTDAPPPQKGQPASRRFTVDRDLLALFGKGLVVLSGGLRGEIPCRLYFGEEEEAEESLLWFKKQFGEDFYLELEDTGLPEQDQLNEQLFQLGKKHQVACVATAPAHYLEPEDAEAQEVLQCIGYNKNLDFDRPKSLVPSEYYLKPAAVMRERFERFAGVCDETLRIAEKCGFEFQFNDKEGRPIYHLPSFRPEGVSKGDPFDLIQYFRDQCKRGLIKRFAEPRFKKKTDAPDWAEKEPGYWDRLKYEVDMIIDTGFAGYFLIVADYIEWAKRQNIPVGPGRGSGAGSLVAYSLGITDLDPIEFKLLFERFINPERISMPDFDVDFCQDRRLEVLEYCSKKYGAENVCQIITFGKLQARAVVKDVGRVMGLSFAETDPITKLFPDELNIKLGSAIEKEPRLRQMMEDDTRVRKVIEYALKLEGLSRNAGVHAAGVIITEEPVETYCPLYVGGEGVAVTQFDKDFSENVGLVKFDFLGLKTLTVIHNAVRLIKEGAAPNSPELDFDIDNVSYEDTRVYDLVSSGDTDGVFQVESSGMKDLCTRLRPNSIEDLTAISALYRPGPLGSGMVDDFVDRKHGRQEIQYLLPQLEGVLVETYGVILYQEQVMQIARELAGYSLGQADMLRRAMGKKKAEEMDRHREIFTKGAVERGFPEDKSVAIFDLMAKFAEYGFNKSHSAAYAVLTYQTAYLKAIYPAEFMAALMTTEMNNTDKLAKYIGDARSHHIPVLPPDVNSSGSGFGVETIDKDSPFFPIQKKGSLEKMKAVRFGLEAIKGVGGGAVEAILAARSSQGDPEDPGAKTGPFQNVIDFCQRVPTRKVNKKVLESLTMAGALDSIAEVNRATILSSLDTLMSFAQDEQEERAYGQSSLFDAFDQDQIKLTTSVESIFRTTEDWPLPKKLQQEKQVVGFYVSGHPMDNWQDICESWLGTSTAKLKNLSEQQFSADGENSNQPPPQQQGGYQRTVKPEVKIAGILTEIKEIMTKKGTRMAFAQLEDLLGKVEVIFFPDAFSSLQTRIQESLSQAEPVVITGELDLKPDGAKILGKTIEWVAESHKERATQVILKLCPSKITVDQLRDLKKFMLQNRGKCPVQIFFEDEHFRTKLILPHTTSVTASPEFVSSVNRLFGESVVDVY
jgi:DNA polymerase III subunit alpha